jgi:hypothetical protein
MSKCEKIRKQKKQKTLDKRNTHTSYMHITY